MNRLNFTPTQQAALQGLRAEFTCVVCTRIFEDPHTLPCSHVFCAECIFDHLARANECPTCRLPTVPRDVSKLRSMSNLCQDMDEIVDLLEELKDIDAYDAAKRARQEHEQRARRRRRQQHEQQEKKKINEQHELSAQKQRVGGNSDFLSSQDPLPAPPSAEAAAEKGINTSPGLALRSVTNARAAPAERCGPDGARGRGGEEEEVEVGGADDPVVSNADNGPGIEHPALSEDRLQSDSEQRRQSPALSATPDDEETQSEAFEFAIPKPPAAATGMTRQAAAIDASSSSCSSSSSSSLSLSLSLVPAMVEGSLPSASSVDDDDEELGGLVNTQDIAAMTGQLSSHLSAANALVVGMGAASSSTAHDGDELSQSVIEHAGNAFVPDQPTENEQDELRQHSAHNSTEAEVSADQPAAPAPSSLQALQAADDMNVDAEAPNDAAGAESEAVAPLESAAAAVDGDNDDAPLAHREGSPRRKRRRRSLQVADGASSPLSPFSASSSSARPSESSSDGKIGRGIKRKRRQREQRRGMRGRAGGPVIVYTMLKDNENELMHAAVAELNAAGAQRAQIHDKIDSLTTHLVAHTGCGNGKKKNKQQHDRRCPRSLKYFRAVSMGVIVVSFDWVRASREAGAWLPIEQYEVKGGDNDVRLPADGPRRSRLAHAHPNFGQPGGPQKLLSGLTIAFYGDFTSVHLKVWQLKQLVMILGGKVVPLDRSNRRKEWLEAHSPSSISVEADGRESGGTSAASAAISMVSFVLCPKNLDTKMVSSVARSTGLVLVSHCWLCACISSYTKLAWNDRKYLMRGQGRAGKRSSARVKEAHERNVAAKVSP